MFRTEDCTMTEVLKQWGKAPTAIPVVNNTSNKPIGLLEPLSVANEIYAGFVKLRCFFETVLDQVNESICGIDKLHRVMIWNPKAEELYNVKAEKILSERIEDFVCNLRISNSLHRKRRLRVRSIRCVGPYLEQYHGDP